MAAVDDPAGKALWKRWHAVYAKRWWNCSSVDWPEGDWITMSNRRKQKTGQARTAKGITPTPENSSNDIRREARADNAQSTPEVARSRFLESKPALVIRNSLEAFHRDLPQLLREHPREWVAYHGDRAIGFAASQVDLYERCLGQGFAEGEFLVQCVVSEPDIVDPAEFQGK
jgi:hypothetical protein